jgi:hypothetical protein
MFGYFVALNEMLRDVVRAQRVGPKSLVCSSRAARRGQELHRFVDRSQA